MVFPLPLLPSTAARWAIVVRSWSLRSQVWGQSSYYVTQMMSRHYQRFCLKSFVSSYNGALDVTAAGLDDAGRCLKTRTPPEVRP